MEKRLIAAALFSVSLILSCKTVKEEIIEIPKAPPAGVLIRQFGEDYRLDPGGTSLVPLSKAPFELIFPVKPYNPSSKEFYAARIVATNDIALVESFYQGLYIGLFPPMAPGSGLAGNEGPYETLYVVEYGSHYVIFDPEDPDSQRGIRLGERDGEVVLCWPIDKVMYQKKPYTMRTIPTKGFTLIIFIDKNLNEIVEKGEWYIADLRFTEF